MPREHLTPSFCGVSYTNDPSIDSLNLSGSSEFWQSPWIVVQGCGKARRRVRIFGIVTRRLVLVVLVITVSHEDARRPTLSTPEPKASGIGRGKIGK
jgi:hypothetical protein